MSRSEPNNKLANPATKWIEWSGSTGTLRFFDKEKSENIHIPDGFTFILLDVLATIKGWHDASDSGIFSNEVRDTKQETMVVKSFKGGIIAEGLYAQIKDKVKAAGGKFTQNCYIAFKEGDQLVLGSIQFKAASLNSWIEFLKANKAEAYEKAIKVTGYTEGTKGRITFRVPTFAIAPLSGETNNEAIEVDKKLQAYLKAYLGQTKTEQVEHAETTVEPATETIEDDDLPF